jgi:hypothetical protein
MNPFILSCARCRKGKSVNDQIEVTLIDEYPAALPHLIIRSDYKPTLDVYRENELYTVEEINVVGRYPGRVIRLYKQSDGQIYDVQIPHNDKELGACYCYGFESTRRPCKHQIAVKHLIEMEAITDPHAFPEMEFPVWPCPDGSDPFAPDDVPANKTSAV